ncbi:MAG: ABC transporter ATP-binding protein [Bacteroidales bacterium]
MKNEKHNLISLIAPYKWKLLLVTFVNFISVLFSILSLMILEPFVNLLFKHDLSQLSFSGQYFVSILSHFVDIHSMSQSMMGMVLLVVILFFFKNLFLFLAQWLMAPLRSDLIRTLRNDLYDKILILPLAYFGMKKKGDVISRAVNDTQEIEFTVLQSMQQLLTEPLTVIVYLLALFSISYQLSFFVLLLLPIAGFVISKISKSLRRKSLNSKNRLGELLAHVEETIAGLRIIKGFNAQQHVEKIFERQNDDFTNLQKQIYRKVDLASPMSEFLGVTVVMIILVFGGSMVLNSTSFLTPALFITYIALFTQIINPAKTISTAFSNYRRGLSAIDRINDILDAQEVIVETKNARAISSFDHALEIKHISFAYEEVEVLKNINITIRKGSLVALVGPSGSGKSTLADLLLRFYEPQKGEILIDGHCIHDLVIDDLRNLFAIVSQDIVLFNDTIHGNIAFGRKEVSREEVIRAAKLANIDDFISQLPQGYETNVGDRGVNLSGGQKQRISIARAILKNAPILLLDEATSAMDSESEKLVQEALDHVMENRTAIVIAHRLSTIVNADMIYVLDEGVVVESGTHQSLMAQEGKYSKLIEIQQF